MELTVYDKFNEVLKCSHCGEDIIWGFSYYWWGISSEDKVKKHEKECDQNPQSDGGKLKSFILKCQTTAKVFDCLNCKQFQDRCTWTENK